MLGARLLYRVINLVVSWNYSNQMHFNAAKYNIIPLLTRRSAGFWKTALQKKKKRKKGFCGHVINFSFTCDILARRVNIILEYKQGVLSGSRDMI